jgi:hypothetical protein
MVNGGRGSVGAGDGALVASGETFGIMVLVALGDGSAVEVAGNGWVAVGVALAAGLTTVGGARAVGVGSGAMAVAVGDWVAVGLGFLSGMQAANTRVSSTTSVRNVRKLGFPAIISFLLFMLPKFSTKQDTTHQPNGRFRHWTLGQVGAS